nr:MAG TPA: hypothetical protein [Caudoviricetes sp.]
MVSGRTFSSRSTIFQRRQLCQQLLAARGLVRLRCRIAHRGLMLIMLALGTALCTVALHRRYGNGSLCGGLFGFDRGFELGGDLRALAQIAAGQTETLRCTIAQHRVKVIHQHTALAAQNVRVTCVLLLQPLCFGLGTADLLLGCSFHAVDIVRVQRGKIKLLIADDHVIFTSYKMRPRQKLTGALSVCTAGSAVVLCGVVVGFRHADGLDVHGKGGCCASSAACVRRDDQGCVAAFALAGAHAEVQIRHDDVLAGAVLDRVAQDKILKGVTHTAVAVDRQGALYAALGGNRAGADEGIVRGSGVQGTGVLLDVIGADDPLGLFGLGRLVGLDGKDEVIGFLDALVVGAGGDALLGCQLREGLSNGHSYLLS